MAGHYQNTVEDQDTGNPVEGATVKVYEDGATIAADGKSVTLGTLATIFSDDGITQIAQSSDPITTPESGYFNFYTNEARVVLEFSLNGVGLTVWNDVDIAGNAGGGDITALATRVSATENIIGLASPEVDLGTFTGSTISDDTDVKAALQELETAVEAGGSGDLLAANNLSDVASAATSRTNLGIAIGTDVQPYDAGIGPSAWDFNFIDEGEAYILAAEVMTVTQQAVTGTGTIGYEKSTNAAPNTFASTTSPITLEAGAKLKVSATSVTATYAVHLERTA